MGYLMLKYSEQIECGLLDVQIFRAKIRTKQKDCDTITKYNSDNLLFRAINIEYKLSNKGSNTEEEQRQIVHLFTRIMITVTYLELWEPKIIF